MRPIYLSTRPPHAIFDRKGVAAETHQPLNCGINVSGEKEAPMQVKREYHGIPLRVISDYLVELGGTRIGEDFVAGEGWSAALRGGEPFRLGALRLDTIHVQFEGDAVVLNRLLALFDLRMIRAGG